MRHVSETEGKHVYVPEGCGSSNDVDNRSADDQWMRYGGNPATSARRSIHPVAHSLHHASQAFASMKVSFQVCKPGGESGWLCCPNVAQGLAGPATEVASPKRRLVRRQEPESIGRLAHPKLRAGDDSVIAVEAIP